MSEMQQAGQDKQSRLENAFANGVRAVTVAGILGGAAILFDLQRSNAVLQTKLEAIDMRIDDLKALTVDRYTGAQATRDFAPVKRLLDDHESRLRDLERRP